MIQPHHSATNKKVFCCMNLEDCESLSFCGVGVNSRPALLAGVVQARVRQLWRKDQETALISSLFSVLSAGFRQCLLQSEKPRRACRKVLGYSLLILQGQAMIRNSEPYFLHFRSSYYLWQARVARLPKIALNEPYFHLQQKAFYEGNLIQAITFGKRPNL